MQLVLSKLFKCKIPKESVLKSLNWELQPRHRWYFLANSMGNLYIIINIFFSLKNNNFVQLPFLLHYPHIIFFRFLFWEITWLLQILLSLYVMYGHSEFSEISLSLSAEGLGFSSEMDQYCHSSTRSSFELFLPFSFLLLKKLLCFDDASNIWVLCISFFCVLFRKLLCKKKKKKSHRFYASEEVCLWVWKGWLGSQWTESGKSLP